MVVRDWVEEGVEEEDLEGAKVEEEEVMVAKEETLFSGRRGGEAKMF